MLTSILEIGPHIVQTSQCCCNSLCLSASYTPTHNKPTPCVISMVLQVLKFTGLGALACLRLFVKWVLPSEWWRKRPSKPSTCVWKPCLHGCVSWVLTVRARGPPWLTVKAPSLRPTYLILTYTPFALLTPGTTSTLPVPLEPQCTNSSGFNGRKNAQVFARAPRAQVHDKGPTTGCKSCLTRVYAHTDMNT